MKIRSVKSRLINALLLLPVLALLGGCASSGGASPSADGVISQAGRPTPAASEGLLQQLMQTVGLSKKQATEQQLQLRIFTAQNLNAGNGKKALALVVKVYYLRSLDRFNTAPFNDFLSKSKARAALGSDLLDSREMLLLPGQRYISTEHLPLNARYLGVVALFRTPAVKRWRFAYDVTGSENSGITLGMHSCAMSSTSGALVTELPNDPSSLASVNCPAP